MGLPDRIFCGDHARLKGFIKVQTSDLSQLDDFAKCSEVDLALDVDFYKLYQLVTSAVKSSHMVTSPIKTR